MFTHYSDHTGRFIFEKSLYKLDVLWGIIHFERMAWVYNSIHLIAQMLAIFVTYSNSYKVVRRDLESALFFNVVLLLLAAIIEGSLTQYQSAKRLFLWTICFCFTAPIIFVCCRLLYAPGRTDYGVVALFTYALVPFVILTVMTVQGFLNFLKD